MNPLLIVDSISKRFGSTQALDNVSLSLYPGEVHALLGENGAGKSTLIKILTGVYQADRGILTLDGDAVTIKNSFDAQALGVAAIHQEPMIFPDLNVAENIFISHRNRGTFVNWGRMYREAEAILAKLDVTLDVRSSARGLTLAAQQIVEIAKAISLNVRVLIMDEPTASLSAHESEQLFSLVNTLRDQGVAIVYISHRMEEVFTLADRISILRDGVLVRSEMASDLSTDEAIQAMVGRELGEMITRTENETGQTTVSVKQLGKAGVFEGLTFNVKQGEVLGFAGLVGSRRTDVGLALFGIEPADSGSIEFEGKTIEIKTPQQAVDLGIAYVTEDRRGLGLSIPMAITSNITLPLLAEYAARLGLIDQQAEVATAEAFRKRLNIRTPSVVTAVGDLSGGNQQKVMLSKWLNIKPKLLILDEPTRGIDVGAKAEVHHIINQLAAEGIAIIMISSDLPEVLAMSDRILVMREGRQMAVLDGRSATQERIMVAAMGQASLTQEVGA
ncbi:MAG: sugar ABC transporter ATP-binding protein [Chloroflexota bacterium]